MAHYHEATLSQLLRLSILICVLMTHIKADPGQMHVDTPGDDDTPVISVIVT